MRSGTRAVTVRARSLVGEDWKCGLGAQTVLHATPPLTGRRRGAAGCREHAEGEGTRQTRAQSHRHRVRTSARAGQRGQRRRKAPKVRVTGGPGDTAASQQPRLGKANFPPNAGIKAGDAVTVTAPKHTPTPGPPTILTTH